MDLARRLRELLELIDQHPHLPKDPGLAVLAGKLADQLGISMSTVRTHIHAVYGKLHVQTRTEAVIKFLGRD